MKPTANRRLSSPAGKARIFVRGFSASNSRSAMRLNVIAALRAPTMATISQKSCGSVGQPRTASNAPVSAKGKAKTECSNLIISSVVRILASTPSLPGARRAGVAANRSCLDFGIISPHRSYPVEDYLARNASQKSICISTLILPGAETAVGLAPAAHLGWAMTSSRR